MQCSVCLQEARTAKATAAGPRLCKLFLRSELWMQDSPGYAHDIIMIMTSSQENVKLISPESQNLPGAPHLGA